jgi:hypothetical protein
MQRGLTFSKLNNNKVMAQVRLCVQEQAAIIDGKITTAHSAGYNIVEHDLPTSFNVPSVSMSDAQLLVYSELVRLYAQPEPSGKGFKDLIIDTAGTRPVMVLRWINHVNEAEMKNRRELLQSYTRR